MRPAAPRSSFACQQLAWLLSLLLLSGLLGGCASSQRLKDVRAFAATAPKLSGYTELSQRYRDTYQRELPYLTAAAAGREKALDAERRAAYPDLVAIHQAVVAYLRALGALADGDQFNYGDQIKDFSAGIKAWPDTGLTDRHVNAVANLARVIARAATNREQDQAVQQLLRDGYEPLHDALDAMHTVLRYYDRQHDNEQGIVLGMLDVEIPFSERPPERLLAALAKAHRQDKANEYRLLGLRHTLAANQVRDLAAWHETLYRGLGAPTAPVRAATSSLAPTTIAAAALVQGAQP
ncbi:hypothetical protein IP91_01205 [Pseudoduganella lurida]|uniref:Uncharacterized protein n=1 Tax=Pseudoduganella lurida TaxID=1036180 RepID=A0A562RM57_9BURK|nr:hypothetical protein [Pseudoduganella lurida]TWI70125.1 hypothetical protein IP91_01205 [Pseudoduganella lurida]